MKTIVIEDKQRIESIILQADACFVGTDSYTNLRAHATPEHLVCLLLLEKKKKNL